MSWVEKPRDKWDINDLADIVVRGKICGIGSCVQDADDVAEEPDRILNIPKLFRIKGGTSVWRKNREGHWSEDNYSDESENV